MVYCAEESARANNGFIQTAQVEELGISRPMLKKYTDAGKLARIRKGLYVLTDNLADEYRLLDNYVADNKYIGTLSYQKVLETVDEVATLFDL